MKYIMTMIAIYVLTFPTACLATVQAQDALTFEGQTGYIEQDPIAPILKRKNLHFTMTSTANYSGYLAAWIIRDDKLYLSDFTGSRMRRFLLWTYSQDMDLKALFPKSNNEVLAEWYSGEIHLHLGRIQISAVSGHVAATETMVVFTINKGNVVHTTRLSFPDNIPIINQRVSELYGEPFDIRNSD